MLNAMWDVLLELAPWLLLGAAISGALHVLLPQGFVHRHLQGPTGVLKAVGLGVPLPLCSCGVIPAGIGLKRDGASDGASVAFMVATPQTGVDSILVSASFLGWPFAVFKVAAAALTGVVAGWVVDATGDDHVVDGPADALTAPEGSAWRRGLDHADEVIASIWGWLVFGIVVSAALTTWLPPDAFAGTWAGSAVVGSLIVLGVSLPMYVCATASVPIAAGLLHAGLPPGAALVFLMAGPATNVATVGAVYRALGGRVLGIYLATVAVGSFALGLLFDAVLPAGGGAHGMAHEAGPVAIAAAVVLVGLFARYAWADLRTWMAPGVDAEAEAFELEVSGMTCGGCARRVDETVRGLDGVTGVDVSLEDGRVTVQGAVSLDRVREALTAAGYPAR